MQVRSLGQEDPLEKEMATHSIFLPGKSDGQRSLVGYSPWGHKRVGHGLVAQQQQQTIPMAGRRRPVINREHLCDTLYMTRMKT